MEVTRVRDEGERIVVEQDGEPLGALVSIEDLRALEILEDEIDVREALRVLADESDETIPWEEAERRIEPCRG